MLQEERMDPKPDYGYDTYKGSGKMKGKVRLLAALQHNQHSAVL